MKSLASLIILLLTIAGGCGRARPAATPVRADEENVSQSLRGADPDHPVVAIETSLGKLTVRLDAVHAPGTVQNFLNYVTDNFYSGTTFHYVAPGKMILGGGYTADGQLKPTSPAIRNEAHNGLKNVRGTLAMARDSAAGIDSATSQFFINLADAPTFDHRGDATDEYGYCVFGEVTEGLDVADRISHAPARAGSGDLEQTPDPPVVITAMRIVR